MIDHAELLGAVAFQQRLWLSMVAGEAAEAAASAFTVAHAQVRAWEHGGLFRALH
jgi:hypothetical protein